MGEGELSQRFLRGVAFSALTAIGIGLMLGFQSRAMFLALIVALCMLFSMMVRLAVVASFVVFIAGILLWAGFKPDSIKMPDMTWLSTAKSSLEAETSGAKPPDLAERLQQLDAACQKGLLSQNECREMKDSLLSKFKEGAQK
jgi:hypothetical protein